MWPRALRVRNFSARKRKQARHVTTNRKWGVFENAAALEMSALVEALTTLEHSELHRSHASHSQLREVEAQANSLLHQRISALQNESLACQRSEIARVECLADERHQMCRAKMSLELNSAIQDSQEAQRIASDLSIKCDELRENWHSPLSIKSSSVLKPLKFGN
jgi:hypothetical protein